MKSSCKYRFHTAQSGIHHKISSGNTTLIEHFKHTQTTVQTIKEHQRKSKDEKEKPHRIKQEKKNNQHKKKRIEIQQNWSTLVEKIVKQQLQP